MMLAGTIDKHHHQHHGMNRRSSSLSPGRLRSSSHGNIRSSNGDAQRSNGKGNSSSSNYFCPNCSHMKLQSWLDRFPSSNPIAPPAPATARLDNRLYTTASTSSTIDNIDDKRDDDGDDSHDPMNAKIVGSTFIPIRPVDDDDIISTVHFEKKSNNFDTLLSDDVKLLSTSGRQEINNNYSNRDVRMKERPQNYHRENSGNIRSSSNNNNNNNNNDNYNRSVRDHHHTAAAIDSGGGDNNSILDVMDSMKRDFKSEIRESIGVIEELKSELARLEEFNRSLTDALNKKDTDLELANDHHNELITSIQNDLFDANNENDDLRDEIESLKEQLRDNELGNMSHHSIDNNNNNNNNDDDDDVIHNEVLVLQDKSSSSAMSSSSILSALKKENDELQLQLEANKQQISILEAQIVGFEAQVRELEERYKRQCEEARTHDSRQEQMIVMLKQLMQQKDFQIQLLQQQQLQQQQMQQQSMVSSVATPSKATQETSKNPPIVSNIIDNNSSSYNNNSIFSAQISSLKEQLEDTIKELEDVKSLQLTQMNNSLKLLNKEQEQQQQQQQKGTSSEQQKAIKITDEATAAVEETKSAEDSAAVLKLQTLLQGVQKERDTLVVQLRNSELRCRLLQEQVSTFCTILINVFLTHYRRVNDYCYYSSYRSNLFRCHYQWHKPKRSR